MDEISLSSRVYPERMERMSRKPRKKTVKRRKKVSPEIKRMMKLRMSKTKASKAGVIIPK